MSALDQISAPILPLMAKFRATYDAALFSENPLLMRVVQHVQASSGKQMRPMLVLLSASLLGGTTDESFHVAAALELLHVASLMHDDVVDESALRRGKPSVAARFNNKVAVLGGDYFLSTALSESVSTRRVEVMEVIAGLGRILSDGELLQLDCALQQRFSEELYFSVIRCKTAALFEACARLGAMTSTHASVQDVECLARFGERLGLCFQIKDDLLDYEPADKVGKPTGNDIREGKFTLPLIHVYEAADAGKRALMMRLLEEADVEGLQLMARRDGGMAYAEEHLVRLKAEALECLAPYPDSPVKQSLLLYLDYVSFRTF